MTSKLEAYANKVLSPESNTKTRSQMMRECGYSETASLNPGRVEKSDRFQQILLTACPDNLIKTKLLEALDFTKPVISNTGEIMTEIPDNSNRLRALELACKLRNLFPKEQSETTANNLSAWLNGIKLQRELNKSQS